MAEPKKRSFQIPDKGYVPEDEVTAEDLAARRDHAWVAGLSSDAVKGISKAKKPQLSRGVDLADLEAMIAKDPHIGPNQRGSMLQVVRWLAFYKAGRDQVSGIK